MDNTSDTKQRIILYRGFPAQNKYTWSPFVTKLEFRLRHARIAYILEEGSTREGPTGKIPYVDLSPLASTIDKATERQLVGDSAIITKNLIANGFAKDLNAHLTPEAKATDMGIRALCEDKLYFFGMSERWLDNYYIHRDHILQSKPWLVRVILGNIIYKKVAETVHLQGCGRFSKQEQKVVREEIWRTLEDLIAERRRLAGSSAPFWLLGGDEPTEADAVVFAFTNSALICKSCPDSTVFVRSCASLMDYARRIHDTYFPDYEKW